MKNPDYYAQRPNCFDFIKVENSIDKVQMALKQAIENRKIQMQNARNLPGPSPVVSQLYAEVFNRAGGYYAQMISAFGSGREFAQGVLNKVSQSMKEEPWEVVRKVAVYSFAIGLFLSLRHTKPPTGAKE